MSKPLQYWGAIKGDVKGGCLEEVMHELSQEMVGALASPSLEAEELVQRALMGPRTISFDTNSLSKSLFFFWICFFLG